MKSRLFNSLCIAVVMAAAPAFAAEPSRTASQTSEKAVGLTQSGSAPPKPAASGAAAPDRLDLDVSVVTGNRELPKVLYIVPWKKAELGDLPQQPFNSLLDETLKPVDRDEFRREVVYFSKLADRPVAPDLATKEKSPIAPTTSR